VPLRFVLARTENVVIFVGDVVAFREGIGFTAYACTRQPAQVRAGRGGWPESTGRLRVGLEFSDGRRTTDIRERTPTIARPRLASYSGGSRGGRTHGSAYWMQALPPPGPLTFACEWPDEALPLHRHTIDSDPLLRAAAAVEKTWPDEDER
jgi:hypothetical protein